MTSLSWFLGIVPSHQKTKPANASLKPVTTPPRILEAQTCYGAEPWWNRLSEPVKKADYDLEDVEANKLTEEQKKAAELAPQTESIYTRNKEVWKATNGDILEDHLVKEGLPFSKDSVDAAHARYVAELQAAEEAKAKEEARKEAERKATETAANPSTNPPTTSPTTANPPTTSSKPLMEETKLLLASHLA